MNRITGVFLPIITPFYHYHIDFKSYRGLIDHYIGLGINGLVPLGTTGECPVLSDDEYFRVIDKTLEYTAGRVPVYAGVSCNDTARLIKKLKVLDTYPLAGLLMTTPYYNRPSQAGLYTHFLRASEHTGLDIIIYNIPYRTGRNMENATIYRLAELDNITAIKDSCGNINQTLELLHHPPPDFCILTGEDILFFTNLAHGGQGGVMASAHLYTQEFIKIFRLTTAGNFAEALEIWKPLSRIIPLLFREPNPGPIKCVLQQQGFIVSDETREPLTGISKDLKFYLEQSLRNYAPAEAAPIG